MIKPSQMLGMSVVAGLALPAHAVLAAPDAAPSAEKQHGEQRRAVQLSLSLLGGAVALSGEESEAPDGTGQGLAVNAAFFPMQRLGVVAEVWQQWAEFPMCYADASCYTDRAEQQTMITAGVRFPFATSSWSALAFDAAAGVALSDTDYVGTLRSAVFVGTLSWRAELGPVEAGLLARASTLHQSESDLQVTTLAFGLLAGKSW